MVENIIELKNLCKSYDELTILDNFSLNIKKNEFLTLLGPSGCGKTTTLKIIAGFEYADDGKVIFEGIPSKITLPSSAYSNPAIIFKVVVFPQPLGPNNVRNSFFFIFSEKLSSIVNSS